MREWFSVWWYKYLFAPKSHYYSSTTWLEIIICRLRNHPCGCWFYTSNPEATEPDCHCKNCGDDLG